VPIVAMPGQPAGAGSVTGRQQAARSAPMDAAEFTGWSVGTAA
jgi:hypothetical protein